MLHPPVTAPVFPWIYEAAATQHESLTVTLQNKQFSVFEQCSLMRRSHTEHAKLTKSFICIWSAGDATPD